MISTIGNHEIYLDGKRIENVVSYKTVSSASNLTELTLTILVEDSQLFINRSRDNSNCDLSQRI